MADSNDIGTGGAAAPVPAPLRGIARIVGTSRALESVRGLVRRFAPLDASVLITGETGTGKEVVARALHEESPRNTEPFIAVNCGAISETLLESELFGHERGAFTGAVSTHRGIFEEAGRGTVFLDEIGEITPRLQAALLRVLEISEIRSVGSSVVRKVVCRMTAATNAPIERMVEEKRFRSDLLYRLKRLEIVIPPLRERLEDIPVLAEFFLRDGRADPGPVFTEALLEVLEENDWPGNVRELRNTLERMMLLHPGKDEYDVRDLKTAGPWVRRPSAVIKRFVPGAAGPVGETSPGGDAIILERLKVLFQEHGKLTRAEAGGLLGISGATVGHYLDRLVAEGAVEKVEPNASPRTHYFRLKSQERDS